MVATPKRTQKRNQLIIHQIFLDIGKGSLQDRPHWIDNMNKIKKMNSNWRHILWTDKKVDSFVNNYYPQYKGIINSFPNRMYLVDFVRYLILHKMGGVYIDLDVITIKKLPNVDYMIGRGRINTTKDFSLPNSKVSNNVMKLKTKEEYKSLIDFAIKEYTEIKKEKRWEGKPGRRFLWSVSANMFGKFVKENKIVSSINFYNYFKDFEARSWSKVVNPKYAGGFRSRHKGKVIKAEQATDDELLKKRR